MKLSHGCLIEDDLQMSYQKMSCRCRIGDDLVGWLIEDNLTEFS